jgi:capsular exopolysaccharide synthesis family protein
MLDRHSRGVAARSAREPPSGAGEIGLPDLINFWRRQRFVLILTTCATLLLGAIYLVTATPFYTATTSLLIETRKLALFTEGDIFGESVMSNANLETQIQLILSGRIAETVARKLDLMNDAEFMNPASGVFGTILGKVSGLVRSEAPPVATPVATTPSANEDALVARAAGLLRSGLKVQRVGLSYVINVSYTSADRVKAAEIANAYTVAYVEDLFNAQVAIAQRGSDWLLARIRDLSDRAADDSLPPKEKSAIRTTYDSFLQRYTELVQQQSLPSTEARVITPALNGAKTSPIPLLVIGASLVLGGVLGFGIGLVRDLLDRAARTQHQIEAVTGTPFLGYLPAFNIGGLRKRIARWSRKKVDMAAQKFTAEPAYSVALSAPFSHFSETLRSIKLAAEKAVPGPVIVLGVISSLPNEGKTTVAINLARLVAQSGSRVLLIDGDLRGGGLSHHMVPPDTRGLVQLVQDGAPLRELMWSDPATLLQFLPTGATAKLSNANEILSSAGVAALLEACRRQYDMVVIDLPAVLPVVDARAVAHLIDGFVFVVEWGSTTEDTLAQAFHVDGIADKVIGSVLNKVKLASLRRYQHRPAEIAADQYLETYRHVA